MYAFNLDYMWDILPKASSAYRPDQTVTNRLHAIHPGLSVSWVSVCDICGHSWPGDMSHCPGKVMGRDHNGTQIMIRHTKQSVSGYWGVYIDHPMYENIYSPSLQQWFKHRVIHPMYLGWIPPRMLTEATMLLARMQYPKRNRMQGVVEIGNDIELKLQKINDNFMHKWADASADEHRNWQRDRRDNGDGMPIDAMVSVPSNYAVN